MGLTSQDPKSSPNIRTMPSLPDSLTTVEEIAELAALLSLFCSSFA
jgi:hypothetical protein